MTTAPICSRGLFQHWRHSREEDAGAVEVYRPEGVDLPPSFGREGFAFRPDGQVLVEELGPADQVFSTKGRWRMIRPLHVVLDLDGRSPGDEPRELALTVLSVDDTALRIVREPMPDTNGRGGVTDIPSRPRPLDFERARVVTRPGAPAEHVLEVVGVRLSEEIEVLLSPVVYVQQPDYWEIEVLATGPEPEIPVRTPYEASLPVNATLGRCGIDVVGATRRRRIDVTDRA